MRIAVEVLVPLRLFVFVVIHKLGGFVISPSIRNLRIFDFNQIQKFKFKEITTMTKLSLEQQELLFANDCKLINLRYEYHGYTGTEKWAIVTELAEEELWVKYPDVIRRYTPFILLSMAQGEVITEYQNYEARERMRRLLFGHAFDINDGEFEVHHPELAVDTDPIEEIMLQDNIKRLREVLCYLSETQKRRVFKYFFYNKTLEKIADEEGVDFTSVRESVNSAIKKLRKFF